LATTAATKGVSLSDEVKKALVDGTTDKLLAETLADSLKKSLAQTGEKLNPNIADFLATLMLVGQVRHLKSVARSCEFRSLAVDLCVCVCVCV
jgi:hypothetical protein